MEGSGWVLVPEVRQSPVTREGRRRTGVCPGVGRVWTSMLLAGVTGFIAQTRRALQWKRLPLIITAAVWHPQGPPRSQDTWSLYSLGL